MARKRVKKVSKRTVKKKVTALKKAAKSFQKKAKAANQTFSRYQRYMQGTRGVLAPNARVGRVLGSSSWEMPRVVRRPDVVMAPVYAPEKRLGPTSGGLIKKVRTYSVPKKFTRRGEHRFSRMDDLDSGFLANRPTVI